VCDADGILIPGAQPGKRVAATAMAACRACPRRSSAIRFNPSRASSTASKRCACSGRHLYQRQQRHQRGQHHQGRTEHARPDGDPAGRIRQAYGFHAAVP
jgi:hypothetical protein